MFSLVRRSYDTVPCLPHSKGAAAFVFQVNCRPPDKWPVGFCPVCFISCVNNWHVSLVIRKWFLNFLNKYARIVTLKYPFTQVNSLCIKQATAARSISRCCYREWYNLLFHNHPALKPRKCSKSLPFSTQQSFTQHALFYRACDLEFWEAVGSVPFDQWKFRKFEPVIFVEWKAPFVS